jgi:hypothetical protein
MNEDQGTDRSRTDTDDDQLDVHEAAAILADARDRALRELRASYPLLFAVWGLFFLIGYGVLWLSVRGQHPYSGPTPAALLVLTLLLAAAAVTTVIIAGRAYTGIGGASAAQRRVHGLAVALGLAGVFTLEGGLAHAHASDSVLGVYGAVAPLLVAGVVYAASPAVWQDWATRVLGAWVVLVAAGSAYAGPVGVWGVAGLGAAAGFWAMAAVARRRART